MDVTGLADPYVKIYLLYNSQRIAKRKTRVKKRTLSPVFNESFVFDIPNGADGLNNVSLEFMLIDWDRVTRNEVRSCNFAFIPLWLLSSSKYPRFNQFFRTLFSPVNIYIFFNNIIVDAIIILLIISNRKIFHFFNLCIANLNFL